MLVELHHGLDEELASILEEAVAMPSNAGTPYSQEHTVVPSARYKGKYGAEFLGLSISEDTLPEEFEFEARIEEASPDDGLPGPVLYDVTANFIFDDGTTATVEDTDVGPSYPVSFAEALSPADGIL